MLPFICLNFLPTSLHSGTHWYVPNPIFLVLSIFFKSHWANAWNVLAKSLQLCPTLCDSIDCSPPGSSAHGNLPGKSTGVGCHFLLQGIFPTQGSNPHLLCRLHWQTGSLPLAPPGKPNAWNTLVHLQRIPEWKSWRENNAMRLAEHGNTVMSTPHPLPLPLGRDIFLLLLPLRTI